MISDRSLRFPFLPFSKGELRLIWELNCIFTFFCVWVDMWLGFLGYIRMELFWKTYVLPSVRGVATPVNEIDCSCFSSDGWSSCSRYDLLLFSIYTIKDEWMLCRTTLTRLTKFLCSGTRIRRRSPPWSPSLEASSSTPDSNHFLLRRLVMMLRISRGFICKLRIRLDLRWKFWDLSRGSWGGVTG